MLTCRDVVCTCVEDLANDVSSICFLRDLFFDFNSISSFSSESTYSKMQNFTNKYHCGMTMIVSHSPT